MNECKRISYSTRQKCQHEHVSHFQLLENATLGTNILRVSATDRDEGNNGVISYFIGGGAGAGGAGSGDSSNQFRVDPTTGWISTAKEPLVCKRVCKRQGSSASASSSFSGRSSGRSGNCPPRKCSLTIEARDHGSTPLKASAYVNIELVSEIG